MKLKKNYKVVISESAKKDILKNAKWYNKQKKGLGKQFTQNVKECVKYIQSLPDAYQKRYRSTRIGIPKTFPYLIVYDVDDKNKTIRVIAVIHSSRNPEKWMSRT